MKGNKPLSLINKRRYRLTCAVPNPELDRRERYNPAKLRWSKGDEFRADVWLDSVETNGKTHTFAREELRAIRMEATPRSPIGGVPDSHVGFAALVAACELLPESARDALETVHGDPYAVLDALLRSGELSVERLLALASTDPGKAIPTKGRSR